MPSLLTLPLPAPAANRRFALSVAETQNWLASLPMDNAPEAGRCVADQIAALNRGSSPLRERLVLTALLRDCAEQLFPALNTQIADAQITRPDGSDNLSFCSGHSAAAFTFAEVLHQEFKEKPWIAISGYALATSVAAMRIANNKHWLSDVLVGAGIGMLSTKLIYASHRYKWKWKANGMLVPFSTSNGQNGFRYVLTF